MRRKYVSAREVPCPECGVEAGAPCIFQYGPFHSLKYKAMHNVHGGRVRDANDVQNAVNTLLESYE